VHKKTLNRCYRTAGCLTASIGVFVACLALACNDLERLPFDRSHPVIITNDAATHDVYQIEFALALNSRGDIRLRGLVAEKVWRGYEFDDYENDNFHDLVAMAGRSGMVNLPPVFLGYRSGMTWTLATPPGARIEDTVPIESDGARFILREVLGAQAEKPVVIIAGGQATSIASAYLMAVSEGKGEEFRNKAILIADFGEVKGKRAALNGFNLFVDPWAAYVVLKRLRTVLTTYRMADLGRIDRQQMLASMPASELARFMFDKDLTNEWLPGNIVGDSQGLALLFYPQQGIYFGKIIRMAARDEWAKIDQKPWFPSGRLDGPVIEAESRGNIWVAGRLNPQPEADLFVDVIKDPRTFTGTIRQRYPFNGRPAELFGKIEAEQFDYGQEGVAYRDEAFSEIRPFSASALRMMERPDILEAPSGVHVLGYFGNGEWEDYTVNVPFGGEWRGAIRIASAQGGQLSLQFRAIDSDRVIFDSGTIPVPPTGGDEQWVDMPLPGLVLEAGPCVMRLRNESVVPRLEAEQLRYESNVSVETVQHPAASGQQIHLVHASRKGDYIEYRIPPGMLGQRLILGYQAGVEHGNVMLKINDRLQTNRAERPFVIDQFVWNPGWRTFEFGSLRLDAAAEVRLRFEAIDKNLLSSGWKMSVDYIELLTDGPYRIDYFTFEPSSGATESTKPEARQASLMSDHGHN
jgi:hypothetical protein